MMLVRWVKLLNLYSQPEAWACFHDLLGNQLSLLHVTSGQVCVVRTCLLGNNFLWVSCFFYILWTEAQHPFCVDHLLKDGRTVNSLERILSLLWSKGQVYLLPSIIKRRSLSRARRWGTFACSRLQRTGEPILFSDHCVSCVTWPSSRDSGNGATRK